MEQNASCFLRMNRLAPREQLLSSLSVVYYPPSTPRHCAPCSRWKSTHCIGSRTICFHLLASSPTTLHNDRPALRADVHPTNLHPTHSRLPPRSAFAHVPSIHQHHCCKHYPRSSPTAHPFVVFVEIFHPPAHRPRRLSPQLFHQPTHTKTLQHGPSPELNPYNIRYPSP